MIEFNDKLEQIEIKETLSFKHHVLPVFNDIRDDLKLEDEDDDIKKFLNYELTHDDKMEILHYIEDEYDRTSNYYDNKSIFDEEMIAESLMAWITDNFDIEF